MPTEDPEIRRAIEFLEGVMARRGRSGSESDPQLEQARAAMARLGVDPGVVTDVLYPPPPPEPIDPAVLARTLRRHLADLGFAPDELQGPALPTLTREQLDRQVEQAVRNAAASASQHPPPGDREHAVGEPAELGPGVQRE